MQFTIWLTYKCNMRCSYCYEGENKDSDEMNFATANRILMFIKNKIFENNEECMINFHGGEPLLNYSILEYLILEIRKWNNEKISLILTTNAVLLDESKIRFLTSNLDEISISIDGKQGTHDCCRKFVDGLGSYASIIKNVKRITEYRDRKCNLIARMTLVPSTVSSLYENISFLLELGFKTILPVVDQFNGKWDKEYFDVLTEEIGKVYKKIYLPQKDISIGLIEDIQYRKVSICAAGEQTMHFAPNGEIYPCAYVVGEKRFKLGNAKSGISEKKLKELSLINKLESEDCSTCSWKERCHGVRCKLMNYAITGDFCKPGYSTCMNEHTLIKIHKEIING